MPKRETKSSDSLVERPLSALLSQILVAFTVEFDNQFEHRMREAGYPGALLSLVLWQNVMRFLTGGELSVRELAAKALAPATPLACLERWGFITLKAPAGEEKPIPQSLHPRARRMLREGWGSGRGIRSGYLVSLTEKGKKACEIWAPLLPEIEQRWSHRFGGELKKLRKALEAVVRQLDLELPLALPPLLDRAPAYPPLREPPLPGERAGDNPLPVLLSQLLLQFTIEFDRESAAPLSLCANTLRVLGEAPAPLGDLARLTGASPETSDIGWQAKRYVAIEANPAGKRGKTARLTPLGLSVQETCHRLTQEIERRWETRFGKEEVRLMREGLSKLFVMRKGDALLLAQGMIPAEGTKRAGQAAPALGRRDIGAAARQRMRDLAEQTACFVRDPANALPHYPLWDMNRGFGP